MESAQKKFLFKIFLSRNHYPHNHNNALMEGIKMKKLLIILSLLIAFFFILQSISFTGLIISSPLLSLGVSVKSLMLKIALLSLAILALIAIILLIKNKLRHINYENIAKIKIELRRGMKKGINKNSLISELSKEYSQKEIREALKQAMEEFSQE